MTRPDDLFVDASAYHPPGKWEARAGNLLVLVVAGLLLLGGWMFKDWMQDQFRYLALAEGEIAIPYPPAWALQSDPTVDFRVVDPTGPQLFPAREEVRILALPEMPQPDAWTLQRVAALDDYVELSHKTLALGDGRPAALLEYAYAVKPPPDQGASLVAVHAIDLAFPARYEGEEKLVVVTLAAEASDWDRVRPTFQRILQRIVGKSVGW